MASASTDSLTCWKCGAEVDCVKVGFRAACDGCHAWLHCCLGCCHYAPGKPNDCGVPGTDPIRDREAANYCEEFAVLVDDKPSSAGGLDAFESLFK